MNLHIKNWSILVALTITLFIGFGCQKDDATVTVLNVNTGLTISLDQTLSENGGIPSINISTTDAQDCSNAKFMFTTSTYNNQAELNLTGITLNGETCQKGNDKITTSLLLGKLYPFMNFIISLGEEARFSGLVTLNDQKAKLNMKNQKGIVSKNNEIVLIENGVFWGSLSLKTGIDSTSIWNAQKLIKEICRKDFQPIYGDYGFFSLSKDGISINAEGITGFSTNFLIKIDPLDSKDLILKLQKIPGIKGNVFSYDGNTYSW